MTPVKHRKILSLSLLCGVKILLIAALLLSAGCPSAQPAPSPPLPVPSEPQDRYIQVRLQADKVLGALATRKYRNLEALIVPRQPPLSGREIAVRLLGQYAQTAEIERWDMANVRINFDAAGRTAEIYIPIVYRPRPTLATRQVDFFLRFTRSNNQWLLALP